MSITSTCRRTLSIARAVIVAELVFVRGLWCGKRSGAYLVFGQTTSGYLSPMRVMGSQQVVMHDTNHLVESALFRSSKQLDDTTPDSIDNENGFTRVHPANTDLDSSVVHQLIHQVHLRQCGGAGAATPGVGRFSP
jgi:hypothetical protein